MFANSRVFEIQVKNLYGFGSFVYRFNHNNLNIIIGSNGIGKTTVLTILNHVINNEVHKINFNAFDEIKIIFESGYIILANKTINYFSQYGDKKTRKDFFNKEFRSSFIPFKTNPTISRDEFEKIINSKKHLFDGEMSKLVSFYALYDDIFSKCLLWDSDEIYELCEGDFCALQKGLKIFESFYPENSLSKKSVKITRCKTLIREVELINDMFEFKLVNSKKKKVLHFYDLSTGEQNLFFIIIKLAIASRFNSYVIIDEPEISLHLKWQEKLIEVIKNYSECCPIIVATHSTYMLGDYAEESLVRYKYDAQQ